MGLINRLLTCLLVFTGIALCAVVGVFLSLFVLQVFPATYTGTVYAVVSVVFFVSIVVALIGHFFDR